MCGWDGAGQPEEATVSLEEERGPVGSAKSLVMLFSSRLADDVICDYGWEDQPGQTLEALVLP